MRGYCKFADTAEKNPHVMHILPHFILLCYIGLFIVLYIFTVRAVATDCTVFVGVFFVSLLAR